MKLAIDLEIAQGHITVDGAVREGWVCELTACVSGGKPTRSTAIVATREACTTWAAEQLRTIAAALGTGR